MVRLKLVIVWNVMLICIFPQTLTSFIDILKPTMNTMKPTKLGISTNPKRVVNASGYIKAVRRGVYELSGHATFLRELRNFTAHFEVLRFYNGYRPFWPNTTVYYCEFMAGRKWSPFLDIGVKMLKASTNITVTCPIKKGLLDIRGVRIVPEYFPTPIPKGKYRVQGSVFDDTKVESYIGGGFLDILVEEHDKV